MGLGGWLTQVGCTSWVDPLTSAPRGGVSSASILGGPGHHRRLVVPCDRRRHSIRTLGILHLDMECRNSGFIMGGGSHDRNIGGLGLLSGAGEIRADPHTHSFLSPTLGHRPSKRAGTFSKGIFVKKNT